MVTKDWFPLDSATANVLVVVVGIIFILVQARSRKLNPSGLPVFNDRKWFEFGYDKAKKRYIADPESLIRSGLKKVRIAVFTQSMLALMPELENTGFRLILSPKYADMIRNDDRLDLGQFLGSDFLTGIPGFEPLSNIALESKIIQTTTKTKITRQTPKLVSPLTEEAARAMDRIWSKESEWHQVNLKNTASQIVAQMVSRAYLGNVDLCRNPAWLQLMYDLLEESFITAHILRRWPRPLRSLAAWSIPNYRTVRAQLKEATEYLQPLFDEEKRPVSLNHNDDPDANAISWLKNASKGRAYNFATLLITLGFASLDTSADLLVKVLCDLSDNATLVDDIRNEIIEVVGKEGLTKSSIQNLRLLDSAMKESQRIAPLAYVNMLRLAKEKVVLPDGLIIPKGTALMVSACHMMDSSVWTDGEKYDGYRFANLRKSEKDSTYSPYLFTSTSPDHMGFGHGKQACPGRHYAATLGKIALCHILLKYDFDVILPPEGRIAMRGHNMLANSNIRINLRRREEEIHL
ncbi:cytochrome P450 [Aspergillus affinis]|uniref:cytochrome P450 n=1 Tax=Aspergillus affinis TaxID=1070780 RepID=UPI0022FEF3C2|nr:cytochrome P450 [Aspergillus affinis]KAI9045989.1 cytochrome P450 [Aspergillus affinis]